jgi:hypothetical protein
MFTSVSDSEVILVLLKWSMKWLNCIQQKAYRQKMISITYNISAKAHHWRTNGYIIPDYIQLKQMEH